MKTPKFSKQALGIDISCKDFTVKFLALATTGSRFKIRGSRKFANTRAGHQSLRQWIEGKRVEGMELTIALEATGVYHEELSYFLHDAHYRVSILLPNTVKSFGRSLNQPSKTDPSDALLIARMALERELRQWQPANASLRQLRHLTRERQSLLQDRLRHSNQLHALEHSHDPSVKSQRRHQVSMNLIDRQLQAIEQEIKALRRQDDELDRSMTQLQTIPQIGAVTAATLVAETGNFVLFESRAQVVKYAGMDIVERQSGTSVAGKARLSKRGNSHLRAALYMPSVGFSNRRRSGPFAELYERVWQRTGNKMQALVAVQRKLLVIAYALVKNGQHYDEEIHRLRGKKADGPTSGPPTVTRSSRSQPVLPQS